MPDIQIDISPFLDPLYLANRSDSRFNKEPIFCLLEFKTSDGSIISTKFSIDETQDKAIKKHSAPSDIIFYQKNERNNSDYIIKGSEFK